MKKEAIQGYVIKRTKQGASGKAILRELRFKGVKIRSQTVYKYISIEKGINKQKVELARKAGKASGRARQVKTPSKKEKKRIIKYN